jgi:tRNA-specific 2-thiouridylase
MNINTKVIVGMSGGVDSSVSALLLKQQGYKVEGLFMKNWEEETSPEYCTSAKDMVDAMRVCDTLDIPLHTVNFAKEYWDRVFAYFLQEYSSGHTPNPDVLCNKEIKFKAFLDYARTHYQADFIATGHYARKGFDGEKYQLLKGLDKTKDQSYFLYLLNQEQLAPVLFPVGELPKTEVRRLAEQAKLVTHNKKDSTGICFIGERKFKDFLQNYLPAQPGLIKTLDNKSIGEHDGLMYYTIGQRQGIKIGGSKTGTGEAWYVVAKEMVDNVLYVVQGKNHPRLFMQEVIADQIHWISGEAPSWPLHCQAKTRYHHDDHDIDCVVTAFENNRLKIDFTTAQRAVTPGQSIVFYQNEVCLGGGIIT